MPTQKKTSLRRRLRNGVLWVVGSVLALVTLAFVLDYGIFRLRAAIGGQAYGSVVVRRYYAVLQKNGKTTFIFNPPEPWTCVNSLFSHAGFSPCWYLTRHPEQRTDI
jgi:hypothetical protein